MPKAPKEQPTHVLTAPQRRTVKDAMGVAGLVEKLAEAAECGPESIRAKRVCDDLLWMLKAYTKPAADARPAPPDKGDTEPREVDTDYAGRPTQ